MTSFFIKQETLRNYADDNTLLYFSKTMPDLVRVLENETNVALTWLDRNEMIANPDNFMFCWSETIGKILLDKI